jgi:hypothetical protein
MSNQLFTQVSLEQQAIVIGGIKLDEKNSSDFNQDTINQMAWTSANADGAETYHVLDISDVDALAEIEKYIYL